MARKKMMAGNWKMNNAIGEAVVLAQELSNNFERDWDVKVDVVICPPFMDIKPVYTVFEFDRTPYELGGQDVYWEEKGAYTGEISVRMLKEGGCSYCIVGHSERRGLFGETNEDVNKKVKALLMGGLHPILCVGESLAIRDDGVTDAFICAQLRAGLAGLEASEVERCVIAYEPIWAIGTGRTATPEQAEDACKALRDALAVEYGANCAQSVRILYGGSVNVGNVDGLLAQEDIDGALVGGASLDARQFNQLIEACL